MNSDKIVLVFASDVAYCRPLAVSIYSTLKWMPPGRNILLVILARGFTNSEIRRISRAAATSKANVELRWEHCCNDLGGLTGARHLSTAAWLRLRIPEILTDQRKALYLDSDILTLCDISSLLDEEIDDYVIAACRDFAISSVSHPWSGARHLVSKEKSTCEYFNSGVMLINLSRWREEQISDKCRVLGEANTAEFQNCDQDALNLILLEQWKPLIDVYNVQSSLLWMHALELTAEQKQLHADRLRLLREAKVLHFVGSLKPWHHWSQDPATGRWVISLLRSGYYQPLEAIAWLLQWAAKRTYFYTKLVTGQVTVRGKSS